MTEFRASGILVRFCASTSTAPLDPTFGDVGFVRLRVPRQLARMLHVFVRRLDKRRDSGVDAAVVEGLHDDVARIRATLAPA